MYSRTTLMAAVAALLISSAATAEPNEALKAEVDRATAAYALGNYPVAAVAWENAFSMKPQAALLYNAAQAHRLAGNKTRALLLYQNLLRFYPGQLPNGSEVERHISTLQKAIRAEVKAQDQAPTTPAPVVEPAAPTPAPTAQPPAAAPAEQPSPSSTSTSTSVAPEEPATTPSTPPAAVVARDAQAADAGKPRDDRPLIRKPWFWGVIGGAAALVITAVVVGAVVGSPGNPSTSLGTVSY